MTASGEASTKQVSEAIREKFGEEWTVDEAWQVIAREQNTDTARSRLRSGGTYERLAIRSIGFGRCGGDSG